MLTMRETRPMKPSPSSGGADGRCRLAWWTLALALICGGILRSTWIEDMEWKKDEQWSYRMSQEVGRTQPWPSVGMPTSLKFPNPGLSVWIFVPIGRLAKTPTSMARAIVFLNMIGLIGFAEAVRAYLPAREREPWIWGLALQAVSPYAVRLSRKIWPPSILTPLLLLLWIGHRHRLSRWGAFAWGLAGALIGQVHLSGWFVAAGLAIGTLVAEFRGRLPRSRHWHFWLCGTALGLIGALPWLYALRGLPLSPHAGHVIDRYIIRIIGYLYGVLASATSVLPYVMLGLGLDTQRYRDGPFIDGMAMHVPELLSIFIAMAIVVRLVARLIGAILASGLRWARRVIGHRAGGPGKEEAATSGDTADARGEYPSTGFYLWSTLAIPGVIFVMITNEYFYHYYFVLCPFLFVWLAAIMLPWRHALLALVLAQAVMSGALLNFVHQQGGKIRGEYGSSYARQGNR
jgi:hypothetical protein